jgi:hypothetical protein
MGFSGDATQVSLVYTRSWDPSEMLYPLTVHLSSDKEVALIGTEGGPGVRVNTQRGNEAIYHDGMWALGPGEDERRAGGAVVHWRRGDAHSLTVRTDDLVVAVRGAPSRGVGVAALSRVLDSIV